MRLGFYERSKTCLFTVNLGNSLFVTFHLLIHILFILLCHIFVAPLPIAKVSFFPFFFLFYLFIITARPEESIIIESSHLLLSLLLSFLVQNVKKPKLIIKLNT